MTFLWGFYFQLAPSRDIVTVGTTCLCENVTVLFEKIVLFLLQGSSLERLVNQNSLLQMTAYGLGVDGGPD